MQLIHPELRKIVRVVGQPSFVQSYERTSIYPKMTAFIEKWNVDIGDRVRKGDVLADLFVPELRELYGTKKATVEFDMERVRLAQKDVEVASSEVKAARARLEESQSILGKYEAEVERWRVQVDRIAREVERQVIAPQILLESQNELKANIAARDAAKATIAKASADLQADEAKLDRAQVNVAATRAELGVAESEAKRLEAEVGYLKLFAPFDGIVVVRNANTWDFVLPKTGDPSSMDRSPDLSPDRQAAPIYVIDRTDIVRIFVDVPERDANYVHVGSEARVKVWAYKDAWMPASVTRISWALNTRSRTMRAEIDLPNPGSQILPAMYAYGKVVVERPSVRALPKNAITSAGGKSFVWMYEAGKAVRTEVQTGITEGHWVEVTNRRISTKTAEDEEYVPIDGTERILIGSKLFDSHRGSLGPRVERSLAGREGVVREHSGVNAGRVSPRPSPDIAPGPTAKDDIMESQDRDEQDHNEDRPDDAHQDSRADNRSLDSGPAPRADLKAHPDQSMVIETSGIHESNWAQPANLVLVPVEIGQQSRDRPDGDQADQGSDSKHTSGGGAKHPEQKKRESHSDQGNSAKDSDRSKPDRADSGDRRDDGHKPSSGWYSTLRPSCSRPSWRWFSAWLGPSPTRISSGRASRAISNPRGRTPDRARSPNRARIPARTPARIPARARAHGRARAPIRVKAPPPALTPRCPRMRRRGKP